MIRYDTHNPPPAASWLAIIELLFPDLIRRENNPR